MNKGFNPNLVTQFFNEYQDRGMLKWQGFYLSDHTVSLDKLDNTHQAQLNRQHSDQMASSEIEAIINQAIVKQLTVRIERNIQDKDGYLPPFIEGKIAGFYEDYLVIDDQFISFEEIYAITII